MKLFCTLSIIPAVILSMCIYADANDLSARGDSAYRGEMIWIPAGSFVMGNNGSEGYSYADEVPQHAVNLSGYYIGKYEVTRGEYRKFMDAGGYSNPDYWSSDGWKWKRDRTQPQYWDAVEDWETGSFTQTDSHPVTGISYYEAEAFCKWAGGHLPTEAQWEKAARWTGDHPNVYPWGDEWDAEKCNNTNDHNMAGGGYGKCQSAPVGSYPDGASPHGCLDMAGNVWEWCSDWYGNKYYHQSPTDDPQGPETGSYRVLRGGGWREGGYGMRCAYRRSEVPYNGWFDLGFRVVR
ncbi:formylglycine-generating enzyme family protein [bacterium]|nr:formylglycine-generating enzyme family protein [bacterium]